MGKWEERQLGDLIRIKHGFAFDGENITSEENKFVLVTPGNFNIGGGFKFSGKKYYHGEIPKNYILKPNSIIVTMTDLSKNADTLGYAALVPNDEKIYLHNQRIGLVSIVSKEIDMKFLYWILRTPWYQRRIANTSNGANVKHTSPQRIYNYKFMLPDLPTQKRIADNLSTYDDLIEKNKRRIELLEKAAQELYKEWFVRFHFPNYKQTKLINGLPEGWEVKRISEICYVTDGTHDTPKPTDEGIPLITGRCINNGFIDFNSAYYISREDHEKIKKRSGLKTGDIIFSNIGTVGNTCLVDYLHEFSVKNVIIFKPENEVISNFMYYMLTNPLSQEIFSSQTNGASQQFVGLTFMRRFKILVPKVELLNEFSEKITTLIELKRSIYIQNENLKKQRDLLLPRLMSGRLEV
jgi:type I restriction enzyme S subunit